MEQDDFVVENRNKPICKVSKINFENMPNVNEKNLFTDEEKNEFLLREPKEEKFFRRFIIAREFLNDHKIRKNGDG